MDVLSLTILLFALFLFSFFLGGTESALVAVMNKRANRLAKRENSESHLFSLYQTNLYISLFSSILNASIIAICIVKFVEDIKLHSMLLL